MVLEYIILNIVIISVYLVYLYKKLNYKVVIGIIMIHFLGVGPINIYQKTQISKITGEDFSLGYTLLTYFLMSVVIGLMGNVIANHIDNDNKNMINLIAIVAGIAIAVIYVLLCFKIDFFTEHF